MPKVKKQRYFAPDAHVWITFPKLSDKYPGVVISRQSGVYRVKWVETGDIVLVKAKDLSERRL